MPIVRVSRVSPSAVLGNDNYLWLLTHLNEDLQLMSTSYYRHSSEICTFAVYTEDGCISVFPDEFNISYEVNYNGGRKGNSQKDA